MWRPWSKALEALGRVRLRAPFHWRTTLAVGDPTAPDAEDGTGWREYLDPERLHDVWGPHPESVWVPFHCVPLFAALDSLKRDTIGPSRPSAGDGASSASASPSAPGASVSPSPLSPLDPLNPLSTASAPATPASPPTPATPSTLSTPGAAPVWLQRDTWTILDLPGHLSVQAAAWLVTTAGCQPVCTFDNWPHPKGVLKAERILAELLRWATTVARARPALDPASPPLWICDSQRLGASAPRPREFDNRYYLDDSILPGTGLLRQAGIRQVVYVTMGPEDRPVADLDECFKELTGAGLAVLRVSAANLEREPSPLVATAAPRKRPRGFRRSSAGGFGQTVPDPSSGGSGG